MTTGGFGDDERGSGPAVRRLILGTQLRQLREQARITCVAAGYHIRSSASKISRLETGRLSFKERDVADLLTLYGVADGAEREQFLKLAKQSRQPGWWHGYHDLMPTWFEGLVGLEEVATRIQTYELQFVPGLLQTEDYARAVATHGGTHQADEQALRRVELRMRRQNLLRASPAPRLWTVIDESVLHRPLGGRAVLAKQIDHLLEVTLLPHVSVQILPFEASGRAAEGSFTLLRFAQPELPDITYVEYLTGALYLEKPEEIEVYSRTLDRLAVDAYTPSQSRKLLMDMHKSV